MNTYPKPGRNRYYIERDQTIYALWMAGEDKEYLAGRFHLGAARIKKIIYQQERLEIADNPTGGERIMEVQ